MHRRHFLQVSGAAMAVPGAFAAVVAGAPVQAAELGPADSSSRRDRAITQRVMAAQQEYDRPVPQHVTNGEEEEYPGYIASYSKGLPHNDRGEVDPDAYRALLTALASGDPALFEALPLGGSLRLSDPQAAYAFDLLGPDSHILAVRPAPRIDSPEGAGELAELYWMALTRDVPFARYDTDPTVAAASADLSRFSDFRGPKQQGQVTPRTLFRGTQPGCLAGPLLSQFFWVPIRLGALPIDQRMQTAVPGIDYMTRYDDWLAIQQGHAAGPNALEGTLRYVRSIRDISQWVHMDGVYQHYYCACLILLGMNAPLDPGLPPVTSRTQDGYVEFGEPHVLTLLAEVTTRVLKATWYQKWLVHRRLRPEAFAGRVHNHLTGRAQYPIHPELLDSAAVAAVFQRHGSYLLPQAFPEGCPAHPSYTAGHATLAGACVTVLKAFFNEDYILPAPVVPDPDGLALRPYLGPPLTVGGELDKLANNIGIGRNMAGVHYRSDNGESLRLGETVALAMLAEKKATHNQPFSYTLTRFDGERITL